MLDGIHNLVNTIIKYHLLFMYFQTINQCQFNNNINNNHRKERVVTILLLFPKEKENVRTKPKEVLKQN